jgi:hypothetical protein
MKPDGAPACGEGERAKEHKRAAFRCHRLSDQLLLAFSYQHGLVGYTRPPYTPERASSHEEDLCEVRPPQDPLTRHAMWL